MNERAGFHIPRFSAWVRQQLAPGEAEIAIHRNDRIVCCSALLERAGLRVGESLERARSLFPNAAFHREDRELDAAIWEELLVLLNSTTPNVLSLRPGWALLSPYDLEGLERLNRSLQARTGIATDRFTAMLAALGAHSGEVVRVDRDAAERFVATTPVKRLAGLGIEVELIERLELFGLRTVGAVSRLSRRQLRAQFGPDGSALHEMLHPEGPDAPVPVFQPPQNVLVRHRFEDRVREPGEILPVLELLVDEAMQDLGYRVAQVVTVKVRKCRLGARAQRSEHEAQRSEHEAQDSRAQFDTAPPTAPPLERAAREEEAGVGFKERPTPPLRSAPESAGSPGPERRVEESSVLRARRVLKVATSRRGHIAAIARIVLERLIDGGEIEELVLELGGLRQPETVQTDLFAERPAVFDAVARIHRRFPGVLVRATVVDADAPLPEEGILIEPFPDEPERRGKRGGRGQVETPKKTSSKKTKPGVPKKKSGSARAGGGKRSGR